MKKGGGEREMIVERNDELEVQTEGKSRESYFKSIDTSQWI